MSNSNCLICTEKFNKSNHILISCPYCKFEACNTCCKTFILDKSVATCMNNSCGNEWNRKILVDSFSQAFVCGPWKKNRENKLFEKEKSLFPASQIIVENQIKKESYTNEIKELDKVISQCHLRRQQLSHLIRNNIFSENENVKKVFIKSCSFENCRGYLSTQWKCGLCENYTCSECHSIKGKVRDGEHICNPDEVATAKLLSKDTKNCPKCATSIYKIDGCDQMWCTQCHTAFSWRTGQIETKVHNPHFYEWQRLNLSVVPRNPGDNPCANNEITQRTIQEISRLIYKNVGSMHIPLKDDAKELYNMLSVLIKQLLHLSLVQLPHYRVNPIENNLQLRVKYLRNKISLEDFKVYIQRDNKKYEKKREIFEVLDLFITTITDIINRIKINIQEYENNSFQKAFETYSEVEKIKDYVNQCLLDIAFTYNSKPKKIYLSSYENNNNDVLINCSL